MWGSIRWGDIGGLGKRHVKGGVGRRGVLYGGSDQECTDADYLAGR